MQMTKRTYKGWTPADDAELVLLREAITPTKEIARVLKRTPSSVANRISILELPVGGKRKDKRQVEMDFREIPKIKTVQGSQPKPAWWTSMMWWRK
jgi:hypothetical protein